jgi:hypothetical protein
MATVFPFAFCAKRLVPEIIRKQHIRENILPTENPQAILAGECVTEYRPFVNVLILIILIL